MSSEDTYLDEATNEMLRARTRAYLAERGITPNRMAHEIGVHSNMLRGFLHGTQNAGQKLTNALADVYKLDVAVLLGLRARPAAAEEAAGARPRLAQMPWWPKALASARAMLALGDGDGLPEAAFARLGAVPVDGATALPMPAAEVLHVARVMHASMGVAERHVDLQSAARARLESAQAAAAAVDLHPTTRPVKTRPGR